MNLNDFESQLLAHTQALLSGSKLSEDASASRVAAQVARSGFGSLSWQERFHYLGRVAPLLRSME